MENNQTQSSLKTGTEVVIVEGQLTKIIHQEGQGDLPKKGQQVFALYRGTLQNGEEFDSNQDRDEPFKFTLGVGSVIKGWDEGFASMKRGQKATLVCSPDYAYGKRGSPPKIPPNSTLNFQVELLDFVDKKRQKYELSDEQKNAEATVLKNKGNQAFKKGDFKQATKFYTEGLSYVDGQQSCQQIQKVLRLNVAQSQNKIGEFSEAIRNCTIVLEKDASNVKALYRRGTAHLKSQDFDKAQNDFQELLKIDPTNVEAQKQLQNVKAAERALLQKQKKVYGGMFSKAGTYSEEAKKQQAPKVQSIPTQQASKPQQFQIQQIPVTEESAVQSTQKEPVPQTQSQGKVKDE